MFAIQLKNGKIFDVDVWASGFKSGFQSSYRGGGGGGEYFYEARWVWQESVRMLI